VADGQDGDARSTKSNATEPPVGRNPLVRVRQPTPGSAGRFCHLPDCAAYDREVGLDVDQRLIAGTIRLRSGIEASILRGSAPLPIDAGTRLTWFLEGAFGVDEKPDLYATAAAKGLFDEVARNQFAWAEVDGRVVSTAWAMTPANDPAIGTLGEVFTDPSWRGHGLAPAVCGSLLEGFDSGGGRLIFLATSNPSAARIYEALGFEPYPRGLMRRDRDGPRSRTFDAEWWATSATTIRPMHWGDTPRIVALYSAANPWLSACWMQGIYSATYVTHDRCNSLVKHTWVATRPGAWLGMFNEMGALVGSGPMMPAGFEKEPLGANVDLFVHPSFLADALRLLEAMIAEARGRGWRWLRAELGDGDDAKAALLESARFREIGREPDALSIGGVRRGIRIFRGEFSGPPPDRPHNSLGGDGP
jgi:GNAT superfamily N-acetyltransferase